jgi:hypothetical protein
MLDLNNEDEDGYQEENPKNQSIAWRNMSAVVEDNKTGPWFT